MGVTGLQSYVENKCPQAFYEVDIRKIADQHRKHRSHINNPIGYKGKKESKSKHKRKASKQCNRINSNNQKVTIIIDLQSCVRSVYNGLDLIGGGQFREYSSRWKTFITALYDAGISPIFVTDGPSPHSKRKTWVKRRYASATDFVFPVLDSLKARQDPKIESYRSTVLPALETERILSLDVDEELEIIKSTSEQDADQLIVQLAIERNAFAIFAQDTDYLIYQYPKHIYYLSSLHFDWKGLFNGSNLLKTKTYDRFGLANALGISVSQLPLLAVMKGNDLVSTEHLQRFHEWIKENGQSSCRNYNHAVIEGLAQFILFKNFPTGESIFQHSNSLADFIFYGDMGNQKYLEQSLQSYFLKYSFFTPFQSSHKECQWLALVEMQKPGSKLRNVMEGGSTESSTRLEEYRDNPLTKDYLPPNAKFLKKLYQRLWGVLLMEKPGALTQCRANFAIQVEEWHMSGVGSLDKPTFCKPTVPPKNVYNVGLLAELWSLKSERDQPELHHKRWKLFSYIFSPMLDSVLLQSFPANKIFLICQLFLFQHGDNILGPLLFGWEIKVLIILHYLMLQTPGNSKITHK